MGDKKKSIFWPSSAHAPFSDELAFKAFPELDVDGSVDMSWAERKSGFTVFGRTGIKKEIGMEFASLGVDYSDRQLRRIMAGEKFQDFLGNFRGLPATLPTSLGPFAASYLTERDQNRNKSAAQARDRLAKKRRATTDRS